MFSKIIRNAVVSMVIVGLAGNAFAGKEVGMSFDKPSKPGTVHVKFWRSTGEYDKIDVPIPAFDPTKGTSWAEQKRDAIYDAIKAKGYTVEKVGTDGIKIKDLPDYTTKVYFRTGDTEEGIDKTKEAQTPTATIAFDNLSSPTFIPFDHNNQPAIFTAGIITDAGELMAQVSAEELNFQTDGPIICQALFQRLAPQAPYYGAQINYAGDRLEVYFDPAYTVGQGGVIFGTTSPTDGCEAGVDAVTVVPPPPCVGDLNGDNVVNLVDLSIVLANYGKQCPQ